MSRAPEYDRDEVLRRATEVFWERGYGATSVPDLVAATGLQPGSLYAAFGSKRGVFLEVLGQYNDRFMARIEQLQSDRSSAIAAIEALLESAADDALNDPGRRGCLAVNALLELSRHEPEIGALLCAHNARVHQAMARLIAQAQHEGDIAPGQQPEALSAFLLNNLWGMRVLCRQPADRDALRAIVQGVLTTLKAA
jgi:TetR/AcrR family transcriptional repressor of nem operon